jgi:hypothetical protein
MRIFGKVALNARALLVESLAQYQQFGDEPVDVLHRGTGHALQQCYNAAGDQFAVSLGRSSKARAVASDEFADFRFYRCFDVLIEVGRLSGRVRCHCIPPLDNSRITPPLRVAQRCPKITKRECDGMATAVNTKRRLVLLRYWLPPPPGLQ